MSFESWIIDAYRQQGREEEAKWAEEFNARLAKGLNYDNEFITAYFPHPGHSSHHLHKKLAFVLGWVPRANVGVVRATWITGRDEGKETVLHVIEFRHVKTNLHVLAAVK